MGFWKRISGCVYSSALYREVAQESFLKSFGFFVRWIALLAGVISLYFIFSFGMFLCRGDFVEMVSNVKSLYPKDLVITVEKGHVSTNQDQPYGLAAPSSGEGKTDEKEYDYWVVFDTEYPVTAESARDYNTPVLIGETSIGFQKSENEFRTYGIPKDLSVVIDRAWTDAGVEKIAEWTRRFGLLIAIGILPVGLFVGFFIESVFSMLFFALCVLAVARIKGVSYTYKQAYAVSMYLAVAPQAIFTSFAFPGTIPFFRTICIIVLATVNIKKEILSDAAAAITETVNIDNVGVASERVGK